MVNLAQVTRPNVQKPLFGCLESVLAGSSVVDRRHGHIGPLDAQRDARGCQADVDLQNGLHDRVAQRDARGCQADVDLQNGLDDRVALQDLEHPFRCQGRSSGSQCWPDRFEERVPKAAACADVALGLLRCMTLLAPRLGHSPPGARDLKLLQQSLATAVSPFIWGQRKVAHGGFSVGALATVPGATEGLRARVPAAHHTARDPCGDGHDLACAWRAEHTEVLSAGTSDHP